MVLLVEIHPTLIENGMGGILYRQGGQEHNSQLGKL